MVTPILPVLVTVSPPEAAETFAELLGDEYGAVVLPAEPGTSTVEVTPIDDRRRGVVLYRVIQASRAVAERHPGSTQFLVTEEGSKWRLPPPAI